MNKENLLERLSDIEWDDFEVKEASKNLPQNIWDTVSAFSNTAGGWIVLGVKQNKDKFEIVGINNAEKMEQDFINVLRSREKFNAIINPKCKKYKLDGKTIFAFYVPASDKKPIFFNSIKNTFIRAASGDQRASDYEVNALYREQSFGAMSAKRAKGTSVKSLNKASYLNFRDYLNRINPALSYNSLSNADFNKKLQIVDGNNLTYGGLLFLGSNDVIQKHFSDFRVDYLEIPGLSYAQASPRYTFRISEQENLWEYYFVLMQRLKIYADNIFHMDKNGSGFDESPQFDALREALVNMIMHCDYFSPMKPRIR
ncbi:MAG: putative DNA binding domain-containing protein [Elusimicrobiota bacterium]|jgi:predicted HTH transcriptional regulator|nr:putative DNA binding domain-containing protein [Elusimicrobiota bacterium]